MKQAEIVLGNEYLCRVSGALVRVRAVEWLESSGWLLAKKRRTCKLVVVRCDNGKKLSPRNASALRPLSRKDLEDAPDNRY